VILQQLLTFLFCRLSDSGRQTVPFSLNQIPDSDSRLPQCSPGDIQSVPKRHSDEDGKSVSSNMKKLSLQQGKAALSNKRAAAELTQGLSLEEGGRPNKLRSASTEDSLGRGPSLHSPRAAVFYDAARDQRSQPRMPEVPSHEPHGLWSSPPVDHLGGELIPRDRLTPTFQPSLDKNNPPSAHPELEGLSSTSPPLSPAFNTGGEKETTLLLQPETRPITQEQLVNEVKGIYAGLVMVERKCVEVPCLSALV
jgi:hypothetical protein